MKIEHFALKLAYYDLIIITGIDTRFNNFALYEDSKNHLILRYRQDNFTDILDNELYWVAQIKINELDYKIIDTNYVLGYKSGLDSAWDLSHEIQRRGVALRDKTIIIEQISVENFFKKYNDLEKRVRAIYQIEFENVFNIFLQELMKLAKQNFDPNSFVKIWNMAHDLYLEDTVNRAGKLNKITNAILKQTKGKIEEEKSLTFGH